MKYPKEKIKSKCHHQGRYVSKARRKPQKGAYGCKVKVSKIFDRIYDADDYAAECPVTCLLTPRDIEKSYEKNGFFDADEGERGCEVKQYKFKYKGKWHDILCVPGGKFKGEAIADTCFGAPDEYHFRVLESSLPKLLATLRKLNIEVAEVCGNLKWKYNKAGWFESQEVVRNDKLGRYYVQLNTIMSDNKEIRVKDFEATFAPTDEHDDAVITFCYFDTEREAKAACQADFQKRRAR